MKEGVWLQKVEVLLADEVMKQSSFGTFSTIDSETGLADER